MTKINRKFYIILLAIFVTLSLKVESKIITDGNSDAKITVKVFSSLTCPACANFHSKIYYQLKKDFIDKGIIKFEHYPFPLDLAALNAEIILRCHVDNSKRITLLGKIYKNQTLWAVGSDINKINDSIKKIGTEVNLLNKEMDRCLNDEKTQDEILNLRIEAQKKYKIESTPTIFINEKRYLGKIDYKKFKKAIEKNL